MFKNTSTVIPFKFQYLYLPFSFLFNFKAGFSTVNHEKKAKGIVNKKEKTTKTLKGNLSAKKYAINCIF